MNRNNEKELNYKNLQKMMIFGNESDKHLFFVRNDLKGNYQA